MWGQTRSLGDRIFGPVDLSKRGSDGPSRLRHPDMGTGTMSDMPIGNVQLSTFNWVTERAHGAREYGDRHEICATGLLARVDLSKRRLGGPSRPWHPDMGTDTMSDIPGQERST